MKSFSAVLSVAATCASLADGILLTDQPDQQLATTLAQNIASSLQQQTAGYSLAEVQEDDTQNEEQADSGELTPLANAPATADDSSVTVDISESELTPFVPPTGFDPASPDLPSITTSVASDDEQVADDCSALRDWSSTELAGPPPFNYDETSEILFDLKELNVGCLVKYECSNVSRVDLNETYQAVTCANDFYQDGNDVYFLANQEDYRNGRFAPGKYEVTLKGTAVSDATKEHYVAVQFELIDICDPPMSLIEMPNIEKSYEIAQSGGLSIKLNEIFSIYPNVCQYEAMLPPSDTPG